MSKYFIATSIPYINGEPHIGFGLEIIIADTLARYAKQQGNEVIFSTGTDEHGGKVAEKAKELGLTPKQMADQNSAKFKELIPILGVENNRFIRTTDKGHEQRAQIIWKNLEKDIFKGKYIGWYCTGCEEFVTENVAKERENVCPNHKKPYEKIEEENYYFRLSAYSEQIKKALEEETYRVIPETKRNEVLSILKDGLEDISISRPKEKISWGIPVPGDSSQVMYVWFEALMNYITVLGYPEHQDFKDYWPASVQVIGKDIIRFHAATWAGMLLGLGLPLPKNLYVHGFVNVSGEKISKSLGNVIHPQDIVKRYGVDAFRYYFLRHIPSYNDGDFTWEEFDRAYHNELGNELGNALQRTIVMVNKFQNGVIGSIPEPEHDMGPYQDAMKDFKFDRALDIVWEQVRGLNQFIDEQKPWVIAKDNDAEHLQEVLAAMVGDLLQIADLLLPFLPNTAQTIRDTFKDGVVKDSGAVLFPKVEAEVA